ncbi:MAG: hypothetical protein U5R31_00340 [Acidimicrobiia bacterium]|nr:hypothetical protein [Acidimicrobiia bacterium]
MPWAASCVREGVGQGRAAPHGEGLDLLGDLHRVGARRDLVDRRARALVHLEVDRAPVGLVVLLEVRQELPVGLGRVGRGVGGDRAGDGVEHGIVLLALVEHDLDRVLGDASLGGAAVVALEGGEALGREEGRCRGLAPLGVAGVGPVDVEALLLGHPEGDHPLGQGDRLAPLALVGVALVAVVAVAGGLVGPPVVATSHGDHDTDDDDDRDDDRDRPVPAELLRCCHRIPLCGSVAAAPGTAPGDHFFGAAQVRRDHLRVV